MILIKPNWDLDAVTKQSFSVPWYHAMKTSQGIASTSPLMLLLKKQSETQNIPFSVVAPFAPSHFACRKIAVWPLLAGCRAW